MDEGINHLKHSVHEFEDFETRYEESMKTGQLSISETKSMLLIDEFVNYDRHEIIPEDVKSYDLSDVSSLTVEQREHEAHS